MTVTVHLHSVPTDPAAPKATFAAPGSLHDLIRAYGDQEMPRYRTALGAYEKSVRGTVVEHCIPADSACGAVLVSHARRFSIGMVLGDDVDTAVGELLRRIQFEERQSVVRLSRRAQRIFVQSLFGMVTSLLSALAVDGREAAEARSRRIAATVKSVGRELAALSSFVQVSARRTALGLYLSGLPIGTVLGGLLVVLAAQSATIDHYIENNLLPICLASGAIGAVISVMARISRGEAVDVDSEKGNFVTVLAGSFRAIIGAVFGGVLCVLIRGGILPLTVPALEPDACLFFAGLAFLAGFTERWAQDTIVSSAPKVR